MIYTTKTLLELYYDEIIRHSKTINPNSLKLSDFAVLASSAINYLIQCGNIPQYEKRNSALAMCRMFEQGVPMPQDLLNTTVSFMVNNTEIDRIIYVIARKVQQSPPQYKERKPELNYGCIWFVVIVLLIVIIII